MKMGIIVITMLFLTILVELIRVVVQRRKMNELIQEINTHKKRMWHCEGVKYVSSDMYNYKRKELYLD